MALSAIGIGTWAIGGGDYAFGWGAQEDRDSVGAIRRGVELGMNWVDTAAIYGLGHSEEVVGKALRSVAEAGLPRPYVFTKCSMRWDEKREIYRNLTAAGVRYECEQSLRRLGVEAIDLYQIHWPDPEAEIEEGWGEMQRLKEEGKVRFCGVSNFSVEQMRRVGKVGAVTSLQPPYSLLNRRVEKEILPYCEAEGIGVINYSPMVSGLLTGKMTRERLAGMKDDWRQKSANFTEPKLTKNLALAELLRGIGERHGVETGVVAIAWTLRQEAVTAAIVGGRTPEQLEGTSKALEFRLTAGEIVEIDGFVRENELGVS